jgi:hypothetical protein
MLRSLFGARGGALCVLGASLVSGCFVADVADEEVASTDSELHVHPKLAAEVRANLERLEKEIDRGHLSSYRGYGSIVGQFMWALDVEYGEDRPLLERRAQVLASPVYLSMPEVLPDPAVGRRTPFHGMDEDAFAKLATNHDFVWGSHKSFNGGKKHGVRPFSVCETRFMIGISKGEIADPSFVSDRRITAFLPYAHAYAAWAAPDAGNCSKRDLDEWYNYRGLGHLRPSWLEANYQDRVLRRMASVCKDPPPSWWGRCGEYGAGRLRFRDRKNRAMTLRQMVYDPRPEAKIGARTDEEHMTSPYNQVLLVEDRMDDGVADLIAPGPLDLFAHARFEIEHPTLGARWVTASRDKKQLAVDGGPTLDVTAANLAIASTGKFTGQLRATFDLAGGVRATATLPPHVIRAILRVDPKWKKEYAGDADFGLLRVFADGSGCGGASPTTATCPLLKRFTSLLDRHEHFYQTYSTNDEHDQTIISQPSPLVACSVTLNAARGWAFAGTPEGGRAGLIFLMRVPFKDILTGDRRSIDTLGRLGPDPLHGGPEVLTLERVYAEGSLDMTRVWLDLATLSSDIYAYENEISKLGAVPADQIEGILVLKKPGNVP